jgi:hypothetical protein
MARTNWCLFSSVSTIILMMPVIFCHS